MQFSNGDMKMGKPSRDKSGVLDRTITFRAFAEDKEQYQEIMRAIRCYRALVSKFLGIIHAAESAGAAFEFKDGDVRVKLDRKASQDILRAIGGEDSKTNGKPYYELRQLFFRENKKLQEGSGISFGSAVWDCFSDRLKLITSVKDPDSSLPRNFLAIRGERLPPRGAKVGIPIKRFRSCKNFAKAVEDEDGTKKFLLQWDTSRGHLPLIVEGVYRRNDELQSFEMNDGHKYVFHKLASGEWEWQTAHLNEEDGSLRITLSYSRPKSATREVNPEKSMVVWFGETAQEYLNLGVARHCEESRLDAVRKEAVSAEEVVGRLRQLTSQALRFEYQRDACPKFIRSAASERAGIQGKISGLSDARSRYLTEKCHVWSRRIVQKALRLGCGKVEVYDVPEKFLGGESFPFYSLKQMIEYKAEEEGLAVAFRESPKLAEAAGE